MKTKILIACHKEFCPPSDGVFLPVAVGKKGVWSDGMLRDDDGENIAKKNGTYNELTALYFAWKNFDKIGAPDAVGLNHYRRYFIYEKRRYAYYETTEATDLLQKTAFDEKKFDRIMEEYDFVAPMPNRRRTVRKNFLAAHGAEDLDLAMSAIGRLFPEYSLAAEEYVRGKAAYFYNAFLFKKEDFFRYCDFLFSVLAEVERERSDGGRFFVSEVLTGIFFTQLKREGKKELRLPILFIGKKASLSESWSATKRNFSKREGNFVYKLKPILTYFIPDFLLLARKRRSIGGK